MAMRVMVFGNKMVTRRLTTSLAEEGIRVISASDGLDGMMALLKQGEFDLAVVDSLAEEAEAACRRINELRAIPLVLVVGGRDRLGETTVARCRRLCTREHRKGTASSPPESCGETKGTYKANTIG